MGRVWGEGDKWNKLLLGKVFVTKKGHVYNIGLLVIAQWLMTFRGILRWNQNHRLGQLLHKMLCHSSVLWKPQLVTRKSFVPYQVRSPLWFKGRCKGCEANLMWEQCQHFISSRSPAENNNKVIHTKKENIIEIKGFTFGSSQNFTTSFYKINKNTMCKGNPSSRNAKGLSRGSRS